MSVNATSFSPSVFEMHDRLFGARARHVGRITNAELWHTLRQLRHAPELERFGLFLVGSRVDAGYERSDIDLVVAPRPGWAFGDGSIERALLHCREYGLYGSDPPRLIDPSFRRSGATCRAVPLPPTMLLQTARLLSPRVHNLIREGRIRRYRRFGRFSIEYWRHAGDTGFYTKLPHRDFEGSSSPYLRPALEVTR